MHRIETKQLILRDFDATDWDAINTMLADPFVTEHMHFATWTEAQRREWFDWCLTNNHERDPDVYNWAIVEQATMHTIGWFGIGTASHPAIEGERDFGYFLARDKWGRGYMTEVLKAILAYEFTTRRSTYISATCRTVNPASARVMEHAGMQHIKIAIDDDGNGNDVESHFFGIYNGDMAQHDWMPLLRAVIYVVQFDADPTQAIDRVLSQVIEAGALGATRQAYSIALAQALASDEPLAALLPQPHSETAIRQYLTLLYQRLQE